MPAYTAINRSQTGLVICNHGHYVSVEAEDGQQYRCTFRRKLGMLVAGDKVSWQQTDDHGGDIIKLHERYSEFSRLDHRQQIKVLASNIDHIVIVNAVLPEPDTQLIDSYLAAAQHQQCQVTLLFNKIDLLDTHEQKETFQHVKALYTELGYKTVELSCTTDSDRDALLAIFQGYCSILVGQSGVGKSSISNILIPDLNLRTQGISDITLKGTHTTTSASLYHLNQHDSRAGDIIDSPGVREYRFQPVDIQEIIKGFVDFNEFKDLCKFHNCKHLQDKGCAVTQAVKEGKIRISRWESYAALVEQFEEQKNNRY